MRAVHAFWLSLLAFWWLGCSTVTPPLQRAWDEAESAEAECDAPHEDSCVTLLCLGGFCGFYPCEEAPGEVALALFPGSRPPAAAAPGRDPRRNLGGAQQLPKGAVMVFPNWNGGPEQLIPPSRQLTPGRWEKHHIFPQARELAAWFRDRGVKIHDYTLSIPRDLHGRIHGNDGRGGPWNQAWREFMGQNRRATPEEIYKHAGELIYRFQLLGGPIQPYYSRPGM
jgi:uncharacterized lipoprotein (TIGR02269 family)